MLRRRLAGALVALLIAGCGQSDGPATVTVAAEPDADAALSAHLYAAALRFYGTPAQVAPTPDPLSALDSGGIQVAPGFTGRLLARLQPDATARADVQVYRAMVAALPEGVAAGDYTTSAEDKPAVAVTRSTADAWGGRDVTAVERNCARLSVGSVRATTAPSVIGRCRLPPSRQYSDVATLFAALRAGQVNAAWTSTAAPDVPADVEVLADRTSLIRAENLVPLYRRNALTETQVLAVNELAGVLDTAALTDMRRRVAAGADPAAVADDWLAAHPLGR